MINLPNARTKVVTAVLVVGIATSAWAAATASLTYKGNVVSRDVRVIDGTAYVPIADVAKILGGTVARDDAGYRIDVKTASGTPGGANEISGLNGKIGQMVFTGKWRFEVTGFTRVPTFNTQYRETPDVVNPSGSNDELVVVNCIVKNAQNSDKQIIMRDYDGAGGSLTDDQEQGYKCVYYDYGGGSSYGPTLIPGSAQRFNIVFSVPKGTNLKDVIFSIAAFGDSGVQSVRVSLAQ